VDITAGCAIWNVGCPSACRATVVSDRPSSAARRKKRLGRWRVVMMQPVRVLIIEDEPKSAAYLRKGLSEHGYVADLAQNGEDGLYLARSSDYDLLVLDIMLPGRDGWSVISELRRSGKETPVLFLTARDFGCRPRQGTRTRCRRLPGQAVCILGIACPRSHHPAPRTRPPRRNAARRRRGGKRLDLTPKEFMLLALLVRRAGEVLSRTLIAEQVWDMNFDSATNVVDVHVRRLRSKVDDPFERKLIRTVRGIGYVLDE
jgi:two-component system copper resistance phosphate regulon response regulator CusR